MTTRVQNMVVQGAAVPKLPAGEGSRLLHLPGVITTRTPGVAVPPLEAAITNRRTLTKVCEAERELAQCLPRQRVRAKVQTTNTATVRDRPDLFNFIKYKRVSRVREITVKLLSNTQC